MGGVVGFNSLERKLKRMDRKIERNTEKAVDKGAALTATEAIRFLALQNAFWRGNLAESIHFKNVDLGSVSRTVIEAAAPYAAYVEYGIGPRGSALPSGKRYGTPSMHPNFVKNIREWVMTKPLFLGPRTDAVAWAIAETISEKGTYPHPYMRPAWFKVKPMMMSEIRRGIRSAVRRS